jgi:hypothetical protein
VNARAASSSPSARPLTLGMRLGAARLGGRPAWLVVLLALALSATSGLIEHGYTRVGAPDRTVASIMRLVVPLASFALVSLATSRQRLDHAVWCAARYGASRRRLTLGLLLTTVCAAALLSFVAVELGLAASYAGGSGWLRDAWVSGWIAALSAAAYAAWFLWSTSFLAHGRGLWLALVGDFLIGSGSGAFACAWPRAHARSLIGGEAVLELPQSSSSILLASMVLLFGALAMARAGE